MAGLMRVAGVHGWPESNGRVLLIPAVDEVPTFAIMHRLADVMEDSESDEWVWLYDNGTIAVRSPADRWCPVGAVFGIEELPAPSGMSLAFVIKQALNLPAPTGFWAEDPRRKES